MRAITTGGPVEVAALESGAIWRVALAAAKGNILDRAMIRALTETFERAADDRNLAAIVLEGRGDHFSFGASIDEHLPGQVDALLPEFHELFRKMFRSRVFVAAVIRGRCLGGGLELASFAHRIFAHPSASFSQPEIRLGVFAPVASVLLPERIGRAAAEDLLLTGRSLTAAGACAIGLVDEVHDIPDERAIAYVREFLLPRSAAALRHAIGAARQGFAERFDGEIRRLERAYIEELMVTEDAIEGLKSFLEKRPAQWRNQ